MVKTVNILFWACLSIIFADQVQSEPFLTANGECKKMMLKMVKRHLKLFSKCTREIEANVKGDEEEFKKQFGCIVKCTIGKDGLLDENGKVTMDLLKAWNEKFLPKEVHEYSENIISGCIEEYAPKMNNENKYCTEGYLEYADCIQQATADIC